MGLFSLPFVWICPRSAVVFPSSPSLPPSISPYKHSVFMLPLSNGCLLFFLSFFFWTGKHAHTPRTHHPCSKVLEFLVLFVLTYCGCMCVCVSGQRHRRRGRGWGSRHCGVQGKQQLHSYLDRTQTQTPYLLAKLYQITQFLHATVAP